FTAESFWMTLIERGSTQLRRFLLQSSPKREHALSNYDEFFNKLFPLKIRKHLIPTQSFTTDGVQLHRHSLNANQKALSSNPTIRQRQLKNEIHLEEVQQLDHNLLPKKII